MTERQKLKVDVIRLLTDGISILKHTGAIHHREGTDADNAHARILDLIDEFSKQEQLIFYMLAHYFSKEIANEFDDIDDALRADFLKIRALKKGEGKTQELVQEAVDRVSIKGLIENIDAQIDLSWIVIFKHVFLGSKLLKTTGGVAKP